MSAWIASDRRRGGGRGRGTSSRQRPTIAVSSLTRSGIMGTSSITSSWDSKWGAGMTSRQRSGPMRSTIARDVAGLVLAILKARRLIAEDKCAEEYLRGSHRWERSCRRIVASRSACETLELVRSAHAAGEAGVGDVGQVAGSLRAELDDPAAVHPIRELRRCRAQHRDRAAHPRASISAAWPALRAASSAAENVVRQSRRRVAVVLGRDASPVVVHSAIMPGGCRSMLQPAQRKARRTRGAMRIGAGA